MAKKIKQVTTSKISELIKLAADENITESVEIAKWIISVSPYWRSKGYSEIMKEIK